MSNSGQNQVAPRPFLKWAGGKRQLLDELRERVAMAQPHGRYHEPFAGGAALFFDLYARKQLGGLKANLSDNNGRLIEAYQGVQRNVEQVIKYLEQHRKLHSESHYYTVRAELPEDPVARAARIIYLNRTCFNGLYRENSKGEFNVPMGRYKNPAICDADNLRAVSAALRRCRISCRHFTAILDHAEAGDFVYFDPPYHPVSKTANFTSYHKDPFGEDAQRSLANVFRRLDERGVKLLLSNSDTPLIQELYKSYEVEIVMATRLVNRDAEKRGKVREVLVRNF